MYQHTVIVGHLGRDPEMRQTQSGKAVCNFSVAVSGTNDSTTWFRCVAWEKSAEYVNAYLHKGDKVLVEGRIETGEYKAQDGTTRATWELVASRVKGMQARDRELDTPATVDEVEEIPF